MRTNKEILEFLEKYYASTNESFVQSSGDMFYVGALDAIKDIQSFVKGEMDIEDIDD